MYMWSATKKPLIPCPRPCNVFFSPKNQSHILLLNKKQQYHEAPHERYSPYQV